MSLRTCCSRALVTLLLLAAIHPCGAIEILISSTRSLGGESGIYRLGDTGHLNPLLRFAAGSGANGNHPHAFSLDTAGDELLFSLAGDAGLHRLSSQSVISRVAPYAPAANPNRLVRSLGPQRVSADGSGNAYLYGASWQDSYRVNASNAADAIWGESLDGLAVSSAGEVYAFGDRGLSHYGVDGTLLSTLGDSERPSSRVGALHVKDIVLDEANELLYASRTRWDRQTGERTYFLQAFDTSGEALELEGTYEVDFAIQSLAVDSESGRLFASALGFVDGPGAVYELSSEGDILDTLAVTGGFIWDLAVSTDAVSEAYDGLSIEYDHSAVEEIAGSGTAAGAIVEYDQPVVERSVNPWFVPLGGAIPFYEQEPSVEGTQVRIRYADGTLRSVGAEFVEIPPVQNTAVPEPASSLLSCLGLGLLAIARRRHHQSAT